MAHRELPCPHSKVRVEVRNLGTAFYTLIRRPNHRFIENTISIAEARALHEVLGEELAAADARSG